MLRDKFAMAAMQGELAGQCEGCSWANEQNLAARAYEVADAMMKERANWDFSADPENVSVKVIGSPRPVPPEIETPPIKYE